ncbi:MAG TPA: ABC transporter ATP-binding protein [Acidimicrobiales bacterium]|nr:ABC transporter ATP-binding protein [Acidimicrobiales bacterium]
MTITGPRPDTSAPSSAPAPPAPGAGPGLDDTAPSRFEPMGVSPRYDPPSATISPDRDAGWIRRMLPVVLAHRTLVVGSLVVAFLALLAQVAVPAVTRLAIDRALVARDAELAPYVWVLVGLGVARGLLAFVYRFGMYRMAYRLEYDLRSIMYAHLSRLSFSFYDRVQSGQLISRANSDIRAVQMFLTFAPLIAMTLVTFGLALAFMLTIHVPLTIVAVAALPGVYVSGKRLRDRIFPLSWINQARQAEVATIVDENVNGVRVVKSFAAEERQVEALAEAARRLRWSAVRMVDARARHNPVMESLPRLGVAMVLLYGGWLVIEDQVTIGTLLAFNAYVIMLQAPFRMLGFFLMMGQRARASAQRIFEILDEEPDIVDRPGAVDLDGVRGRVELRGVRFGYGDGPPILDGFDLTIEPGESVALVGRTGSGKSTVVRLVDRFYDVDAGAVLIDGHDVRDVTLASLRHHVGLVLDEPFLFSVSLHDNIAYGRPDASRAEVEAAARAADADGFIRELPDGYDTIVGERGYTLSGGQRQRIAIARTLLVNPPILVLDDATSAIDVQVESRIHGALHTLMADRTTLVIAHRLSTIALADRVVLLDAGRVLADGPHAELLATEPRYAEILAQVTSDEPTGVDG